LGGTWRQEVQDASGNFQISRIGSNMYARQVIAVRLAFEE